jgi:hypothetical protein
VFKSSGLLRISLAASDRVAESGPRVIVDIPIEQGETEAKAEVLANMFDTQLVNLFVTLDGRKLSGQRLYFWSNRGQSQSYRDLIVISASTSTNDRKRQAALDEMKKTGKWFSQAEHLINAGSISSFADAAQMPANWLYLSGLDQISLSLDELAQMKPEAVQALNDYVMAGGIIDVSKVNSIDAIHPFFRVDERRQFDQFFKQQSSMNQGTPMVQAIDLSSEYDWIEGTIWDQFHSISVRSSFERTVTFTTNVYNAKSTTGDNALEFAETISRHAYDVGRAWLDFQLAGVETTASHFYDVRMKPIAPAAGKETLAKPILFPHGFGLIRLDPRYHRDTSSLLVERTSRAMHANRVERFRSGIGDDYWTWLIPSIGRTPVIPFLVFVVLFIGGVVPGLMIWCNRHKRRVWLVVAMPVMATFFTCLLFGYGLFKDGLGAVSRVRSLTLLDSKGDGIVWSRQTYFAARVPSQGMVLRPDTQLAPMMVNSNRELPESYQLNRELSQQYQGLLPPRTQSQFSITHPLRAFHPFKIVSVAKPNGLTVKNDSQFAWTTAMFFDADENAFLATHVAPGESTVLSPILKSEAIAELRKAYQSRPLIAPDDAPSADQISLNQFFGDLFSFNRTRNNSTGLIMEEDCWMSRIGFPSSMLQSVGLGSGFSSSTALNAPVTFANTFILFGENAPHLERCMPDVREDSGLHTVIGYWSKDAQADSAD